MADIEITAGYEDEGAEAGLEELATLTDRVADQIKKLSLTGIDLDLEGEGTKAANLAREIARLGRNFENAAKRARDAQKDFDLEPSAANARTLERALKRVNQAGTQLLDTSAEVGKSLPKNLRLSTEQMNNLQRATNRAREQLNGLATGAVRTQSGFAKMVTGVRAASTALQGLLILQVVSFLQRVGGAMVRLGSEAVKTAAGIARVEPALTGLTGSSDIAAESLAFLERTSKELKVAIGDLAPSYIALQGAVTGTGIRLQEVDKIFKAVVTSGRAFGQSSAEISLALQAISQLAGKGVASMEELRRQLAERIPNAIPALAQGLGVTIPDAIALVSSGSLKSADALRALTKGLQELNAEAAAGQIRGLTGSLSEISRVGERASQLFGEGLGPAVIDLADFVGKLVNENEELIKQLGAGLGQGIRQLIAVFGGWVARLNEAREAIRESAVATAVLDGALRGLGIIPTIDAESFKELRAAILGLGDIAKEEFDKVADSARAAANDGETSAKAISDGFIDAFDEAARAAGVSNDEILESGRDLAQELARISEETAERRAELQKVVADAAQDGQEAAVAAAESLRTQLVAIEEDIAKKRQAALEQTVANAIAADRQRLESERVAQAERLKLIDAAVAAETTARARGLEGVSADVAERVRLEQEAARKIEEARQAGAEKLAAATKATGEERQAIIEDTAEKIISIEVRLTEQLERLEERRAEAARKAAEERRKAEEKARQELEKSLDALQGIASKLEEIAGAEDEGALAQIKEQFEGIRGTLDALGGNLDVLRGQLQGGATGFDFFAASAATIQSALNLADSAAGSFGKGIGEVAEGTREAGAQSSALEGALGNAKGALDALGNAGPEVKEEIGLIIGELERLAEGGNVSGQDILALGSRLETAISVGRQAIVGSQISAKLRDIGTAAQEGAGGTEEAGRRTKLVFDELTSTFKQVPIEASAAAGATKEAATEIGDGVESAGEAAAGLGEQLADGLAPVGPAIDDIKGKLAEIGQPIPIDGALTSIAQISTALIGLCAKVDTLKGKLDGISDTPVPGAAGPAA